MYCPKCGYKLYQPGNGWSELKTFEQSTALTIPDSANNAPNFAAAYRKTPFRKLEMTSDVWVPLAQSFISGVLATGVFGVVSSVLGWVEWYVAPVTGIVVVGLSWLVLLWAGRAMLWVIEEITGMDIDHDGHVGQPEKRTIKIEVKNGSSTQLADLPGAEEYLTRFCRYVAAGESFSERTAQQCGYGITNFRKLRDIFIARRWAYWKNPDTPQQGIELTVGGKHIINELAQPESELDIMPMEWAE